MTITKTSQKRAGKGRKPERDQRKSSDGASDPIVVLIRLPDLSETDVSDRDEVQAGIGSSVWVTPLAAEQAAPPPVSSDDTIPGGGNEESESGVASGDFEPVATKPVFDPKQFLRKLRVPKPVRQIGVVAAILLLILFGILSIRGVGPRATVDTSSDDVGFLGDQLPELPPPTFPPAIPESLNVSAIPESPQPPESPELSAAPESEALAPTTPDLEPLQPSIRTGEAGLGASEEASPETTAEMPEETPEETAGKDSALTDQAPEAAGESGAPAATAGAVGEQPPVDAGSSADEEEGVATRNYPVTEPSTFQYPSRYEQLFIPSSQGSYDQTHTSSHDGRSIYSWQPSTARLQPRIEAPPIR